MQVSKSGRVVNLNCLCLTSRNLQLSLEPRPPPRPHPGKQEGDLFCLKCKIIPWQDADTTLLNGTLQEIVLTN